MSSPELNTEPEAKPKPTSKNASRRSRRRRWFALVTLSFPLLLLGMGEAIVRLFWEPVPSIEIYLRGIPRNAAATTGEVGDKVFEGDALRGWQLRPNLKEAFWDFTVFSTNDAGVRYGDPIGRKPKNGLRVLTLGDSVTFGYRVPVAWPDRRDQYDRSHLPYPALLEARLRQTFPDRSVQVVPLAVPGYSSHQGLAWLRRDIGRYQPDLVTLCFGWNDVDLRALPDAESLPTDVLHVTARRVRATSQLLARLTLWLDAQSTPAPGATPAPAAAVPTYGPRVRLENFVGNLRAMADLAREHGAKVVVIGTVYRDAEWNPPEAQRITQWRAALASMAAEAGLPYLEIDELTERGAPANTALFGELIHPNALGHRLMADRLYDLIQSNQLLLDR